jgi:hypothetical protein
MLSTNQYSENVAVTIFKVNVQWGELWKPCIVQAVGVQLDLMVLIGGAEKHVIQEMR